MADSQKSPENLDNAGRTPEAHSAGTSLGKAGQSGTGPTAEADLTNAQVGDFRLLRRLARGGMAHVYLAEQIPLKRHVAFKVLRGDLASDESYVRRFHV
ncbi:MAG: hypothetical protein ACOC46_04135, partial [Pirellulales bacterium]